MLVGIRKEFTNKQGHLDSLCAIPIIWEICQKKTKEDETIQIKMLGSSPFIKTSPAWKTKKTRWAGITVNYEMGAKLFKTETLCQKFK